MKIIPKNLALRLHRRLWDWLSKHPHASKPDWPGFRGFKGWVLETVYGNPIGWQYCFLCLYTYHFKGPHCSYCPLDPDFDAPCLGGLFDLWCDAPNYKDRSEYAAQIRDLPVREEVPNAPTT